MKAIRTVSVMVMCVNALLLSAGATLAGAGQQGEEAAERAASAATIGHDIITCDLTGPVKWGVANGIAAYSMGVRSGNTGTEDLAWVQFSLEHALLPQNMYRFKNGRFEQIGLSWVKHTFHALHLSNPCVSGPCVNEHNFTILVPGCTDPYTATRNGSTNQVLGPRYEINAWTGGMEFPPALADSSVPSTIRRRIQVHLEDLDPNLNLGARYFGEAVVIHPEDAQDGHHFDNASWKELDVGAVGGDGAPTLEFGGNPIHNQQAAIFAWQDVDPGVGIVDADILGEGRFHVGYRATNNGDGTWHYEYAVYNLNSDRSLRSVTLPLMPDVVPVNIGFHDVDYHSGDGIGGINFDGADWPASFVDGQDLTWATDTFEQNENANALRWGTMYNYRFDANAAPASGLMTLGLFKPGTPGEITASVRVPGEANLDVFPTITLHPADLVKCAGEAATFSVTAGGNQPISFQWRKDGVEIPGATESQYSIAAADEDDEGSYDCLVSNLFGEVLSDPGTLGVVTEAECSDGVFCNGQEGCAAGICDKIGPGDPCGDPGFPICNEKLAICEATGECLDDGDCGANETCLEGVCSGQLTVNLVASDPTPSAGDQIVIEAFMTNNTGFDADFSGYMAFVACQMSLEPGAVGTVDAFTLTSDLACTGIPIETHCDPGICSFAQTCSPGVLDCAPGVDCLDDDGNVIIADEFGHCEDVGTCSGVPFVDTARLDFLFLLVPDSRSLADQDCAGNNTIGVSTVLLGSGVIVPTGETRYLGTFLYDISGGASGIFTLDLDANTIFGDADATLYDPAVVDLNGTSITVQAVNCGDQPDPDGFCDDGDICDGEETCNLGTGECESGTSLMCDDNDVCTGTETCDTVKGCQAGTPLDCDDGLFCTGVETCDAGLGCQGGQDPCQDPKLPNCNEADDICEAGPPPCASSLDCDDGDDCTTDVCNVDVCEFPDRLFGDANNDGAGNILDVICSARVIFQGTTVCGAHLVSLDEIDIAPSASCGDEALNIVDLVVHARAIFQDAVDECCE